MTLNVMTGLIGGLMGVVAAAHPVGAMIALNETNLATTSMNVADHRLKISVAEITITDPGVKQAQVPTA